MTSKFSLEGKTAIVTGAMGGNGFAIANALAEAGAKLILTDIKENNSMFDELKSKNYSFSFIEGDISKSDFPKELINFTLEKHNSIDILVNCAGIAENLTMEDYDDQSLKIMMDINFTSVFSYMSSKHWTNEKTR